MFYFTRIGNIFFIAIVAIIGLGPIESFSREHYEINTIYFIPTDSQDRSEQLDLDDIMKSIQDTYRFEMERHGFPNQTFRLQTDQEGKAILHKVKGNHNKASYAGNPDSIIKELESKPSYNNPHTIYAVVVAGIEIFSGGRAGVAVAKPWGGWFGNGNSIYSGYALSIERPERDLIKAILQHELGHTFGLSHILYHRGTYYDSGDYIMSGAGDKLTKLEARWLSKVRHFKSNQPFRNNFAPTLDAFHGAVREDDNNITLRSRLKDPDNDGIFQVYGLVDSWVIGWDTLNGDSSVEETFLTDIPDELLKAGNITYYFMDIHGNWMYDFPEKFYTLPEKNNKNEDLNIVDDPVDDCIDCEVVVDKPNETPRSVKPVRKLTVVWGSLKRRN